MATDVIIYTKDYCPYCTRVKNLFKSKGVTYQEIDITSSPELQTEVIVKSGGKRTVPQVFIGNLHIGGFDDTDSKNKSGELDKLLGL